MRWSSACWGRWWRAPGGSAAARGGCWQEAAGQAREALSCWRGEPLADIESDALDQRDRRLAGVGKTALAVRWTHQVAPRFGDGHLYVNLRGFDHADAPAAGSVGMAGLLGKQRGFERSNCKAPVFYGLVALGTVGGTALSLLHVNPIKLLVFVAVINGVAAAPFLVVVMRISGSRRLMGNYVNGVILVSASRRSWLSCPSA